MDIEERNLAILIEKIEGKGNADLARRYKLTTTTIASILKKQIQKVAGFDVAAIAEVKRLKRSLEKSNREVENLREKLAVEKRKHKLFRERHKDSFKSINRLTTRVDVLSKNKSDLEDQLSAAKKALKAQNQFRDSLQYNRVKANINKFR